MGVAVQAEKSAQYSRLLKLSKHNKLFFLWFSSSHKTKWFFLNIDKTCFIVKIGLQRLLAIDGAIFRSYFLIFFRFLQWLWSYFVKSRQKCFSKENMSFYVFNRIIPHNLTPAATVRIYIGLKLTLLEYIWIYDKEIGFCDKQKSKFYTLRLAQPLGIVSWGEMAKIIFKKKKIKTITLH